jgi:hypothetical protein
MSGTAQSKSKALSADERDRKERLLQSLRREVLKFQYAGKQDPYGMISPEQAFGFLLTECFSASNRTNRWLLFNFLYSGVEQRLYLSMLPVDLDNRPLPIMEEFFKRWDTDEAAMAALFSKSMSSDDSNSVMMSSTAGYHPL